MTLLPFDLDKALAGEPVVTRCGLEVTQIKVFDCSNKWCVAAVLGGRIVKMFLKSGRFIGELHNTEFDLFMKPKTRNINGFEVPEPVKTPPKYSEEYFVPSIQNLSFYSRYVWSGDHIDKECLERGLVFHTKEDAIANAKAMLGIDPYK